MASPLNNLFLEPKPGFLIPNNRETLSWENESLKPFCKIIELKAGDPLIKAGEMPTACYLIKSGIIIASEHTTTGEKRMYNFNQFNPEGILLFEANLELNHPVLIDFTAMIDSTLIEIDYKGLCEVAQKNPEIFHQLMYSLSLKFVSAVEQMRAINCHSLIWRYCNLLLLLADQTGEETSDGMLLKDTFNQTEMANFLNVSRTSLHFECSELRKRGLIIQKKREILIPSIDNLKAYQKEVAKNGNKPQKKTQKKEKKSSKSK